MRKEHDPREKRGLRRRNRDESLMLNVLGWGPRIGLKEGLCVGHPKIWHQNGLRGRDQPLGPKGLRRESGARRRA